MRLPRLLPVAALALSSGFALAQPAAVPELPVWLVGNRFGSSGGRQEMKHA